jgi:predicted sugar kinase
MNTTTQITAQELHDKILDIINENGDVTGGYGLALDDPSTVAQLIMNLLVEHDLVKM